MSLPVINFAHANGFPAGSYHTLLQYFAENFQVIAHPQYGHNPRFPRHSNWHYLVDELVEFLQQQNQKVIGVGHSFGGVITFMAACRHPELFHGIVLLDPPVPTGTLGLVLRLVKKTPYIDNVTPAGKSKNRRPCWPLNTDMAKQFSRSSLFKNFDPRCLQDYANNAVSAVDDQLQLRFDPAIETDIFRHLPNHLSSFKKQLTVPSALIYGNKSDVLPHYFFRRFAAQHPGMALTTLEGGHMFPLEQPEHTAKLIQSLIKHWPIDTGNGSPATAAVLL